MVEFHIFSSVVLEFPLIENLGIKLSNRLITTHWPLCRCRDDGGLRRRSRDRFNHFNLGDGQGIEGCVEKAHRDGGLITPKSQEVLNRTMEFVFVTKGFIWVLWVLFELVCIERDSFRSVQYDIQIEIPFVSNKAAAFGRAYRSSTRSISRTWSMMTDHLKLPGRLNIHVVCTRISKYP